MLQYLFYCIVMYVQRRYLHMFTAHNFRDILLSWVFHDHLLAFDGAGAVCMSATGASSAPSADTRLTFRAHDTGWVEAPFVFRFYADSVAANQS